MFIAKTYKYFYSLILILFWLALLPSASRVVYAQISATTGEIVGVVKDSQAQNISSATIMLKSLTTNLIRREQSNEAGEFIINALPQVSMR